MVLLFRVLFLASPEGSPSQSAAAAGSPESDDDNGGGPGALCVAASGSGGKNTGQLQAVVGGGEAPSPADAGLPRIQEEDDDGDDESSLFGMSQLYEGLSGYRELADEEKKLVDENATEGQGCRPSTYGERTAGDVLGHPKFLPPPSRAFNWTFLDLGSGLGKLPITAVLHFNASVGIGVELSPSRHGKACEAVSRLQRWAAKGEASTLSESPEGAKSSKGRTTTRPREEEPGRLVGRRGLASQPPWEVRAIRGNIFEEPQSLAEVDRVYIFGQCFPNSMMLALQRRLLNGLPTGAVVYNSKGFFWDHSLKLDGRELRMVRGAGNLFEVAKVGEASLLETDSGTGGDEL